jgi:Starter unit:ACP transacylase in aflatoxin biosynthesis
VVLIAFRTGLYVTGMAEQLENVEDTPKSWSYVVPEISEGRANEALAEFEASEASGGCTSFQVQNTNV